MTDVFLSPDDIAEAGQQLSFVLSEFDDELGAEATLGELLEILGWSIPASEELIAKRPGAEVRFIASLKDGRPYTSDEDSRIDELNDAAFVEATEFLALLARKAGAVEGLPITLTRLASYVALVISTSGLVLADVNGRDVATVKIDRVS